MEDQSKSKRSFSSQIRMVIVIGATLFVIVAMTPIFYSENKVNTDETNQMSITALANEDKAKDSVESIQAFGDVYKVLMSPRCMNCHPVGDVPLQGDDSHLHTMLPRRGIDGKGLFAMKCANCHQATNTPGLNTPPGNPEWHLPPADMKMVFQGRSPSQLAKQLLDLKQNGHKSIDQLMAHVSDDLVVWGWEPGDGRTKPPMNYEDFKKAWITWLEKGAYAPKQ
jgi:hypothetical protein